METNLIKDEGGLDLHPKKTVICPNKKYRDSLLNVNSKNFKTKDGKKNQTICQKALNKLTSKTQLEPEEDLDTESSDDHNELGYYGDGEERLPESDLDTESSDDHNELGYYGDDEERPPKSETVWNVKSNNFQTEDGKNGTICQKTLNKLTNKTPLVEPEAPSTIKTILPEEDLDTESLDDHNECIGDQLGYDTYPDRLLESDSEEFEKEEEVEEEEVKKKPVSRECRIQYLLALFQGDFGDDEMVSDDEIDAQVKSTL